MVLSILESLKDFGSTKDAGGPRQGSLGRVAFEVRVNDKGELILIIEQNKPSPGFRRIKPGGRRPPA